MANIQHPDGGGRQQPNPEDYTITAAQIANANGDAVVLQTLEAGYVLISQIDTPALFEKFMAWAALPGNSAGAYVAAPEHEQEVDLRVENEALKSLLIDKNFVTEKEINDAIAAQVARASRED